MSIFIAPHNDDETLFGAFTLLREKPLVVVVFDGYVQAARGLPVTWQERRRETQRACSIIGCKVEFAGFRDDDPPTITAARIKSRIGGMLGGFPNEIWAPAWEEDGHHQHNLVADAMPPHAKRYLTYTREAGKSTSDNPVPILDASWIGLKLRALAEYKSQHSLDPRMGCLPHFIERSQLEYYL